MLKIYTILCLFIPCSQLISAAQVVKNTEEYNALLEVALSIDRAMNELKRLQYENNNQNPKSILFEGPYMDYILTTEWQGSIEILLQHIAEKIDYKMQIIGKPPILPVLVSINERKVTVNYTLRNLCIQIYPQATIYVYGNEKIIELRYLYTP